MLNRRSFIRYSCFIAASLTVTRSLFAQEASQIISQHLKKSLHYLKLKDSDIRKFTKDLNENQHYIILAIQKQNSDLNKILAEDLPVLYLMSSDFFIKKDKQNVNYLSLYTQICSNPFANLA